MISISVDLSQAKSFVARGRGEGGEQARALVSWMRRFVKDGIKSLLRAELTIVLERDDGNTRNGFRTRKLALSGIGDLVLSVPWDRKSQFRTAFLPFRKRRTAELEELASEMFLAGMSTRDVSRTVERHFGSKFDSKEISRMVAATSGELDAWRDRDLRETKYKFLYLDGAYFAVRRGTIVERLAFLCVIGVRADDEKMEVLSIEVGDREEKSLWAELFQSLERRGLNMNAVELGIMDGLAGLESAFCAAFPNARTQRCQVHAKRNALKRISIRERDAFKADLDCVFYAKTEAKARGAFVELVAKWQTKYPGAVGVIERDLDRMVALLPVGGT